MVVLLLSCLAPVAVFGLEAKDLPERPPTDAVMARAADVAEVRDWAAEAFAGVRPERAKDEVRVQVVRQDYNTLHFGESCMETPIRIGGRSFERGLGTHANSEIVVTLPENTASFRAFAGIDNNYDTQGTRGSAQFAVLLSGKEAFRSRTLKGGDEPEPVNVPIPPQTRQIALRVEPTEDGPAHDQADWADACVVTADGKTKWLDKHRPRLLLGKAAPPFSFRYAGEASSGFLDKWKHAARMEKSPAAIKHEARWEDASTGLVVTATATVFDDYPAVEWLLHFENRGTHDTPIIEDILAADLQLSTGNDKRPAVLHRLRGDSCSEASFTPYDTSLAAGRRESFAPARGRPSQETAFPFWNLKYRDQGVITAIGWSGQWSASYDRPASGTTRFSAGMEKTRLKLHPGERIRTPRILLMPWQGDLRASHNRFRRLLLKHYFPKQEGRPLRLPVALQTFDRYISRPDWATEAGQLRAVEAAHQMGFDTYWFDAGWFPGGFPNGVGNWLAKEKEFPRGLKPVSDLCHKYGMQFVLWFEPCRVAAGTQIAKEHPDYVLGGASGGLYNLGDSQAREWLTALISKRISEFGVDVYREDYNIDPLDFWRKNDAPDRQGMTEIRFVEGHYEFWDTLLARHPGLWIDNCASGGRRIDLETCMRAVPLWRSDTACSPGHPEWNQQQTAALCQYLPLHTSSAWEPERYVFRSSGTGGLLCEMDYLNLAFPIQKAKTLLEEIKANQKYWYGDFYPLTPVTSGLDQFVAYQLHRPDLSEGIVLAFRRPECSLKGLLLEIQGLDEKRSYDFEFIDEAGSSLVRSVSGEEVRREGLPLRVNARGESLLVRYRPARN